MARRGGRAGLVTAGLGWGAALGVALGALVLAPAMDVGSRDPASAADTSASDARADAAEARADAAESLLSDGAAKLVDGSLKGSAVVILRGPGAAPGDVTRIRGLLDAAGADNAGEVALTEKFTSQQGADQLSSIVANTLPAGAQLSVENRSPGTHAGESLAAALFIDGEGQPRASAEDRDFVVSTLAEGGYIDGSGAELMAADAAVLVTAPSEDGSGEPSFADGVLADMAAALEAQKVPLVVASPDTAGHSGIESALGSRTGAVPFQGVADTDAGAALTVRGVRGAINAR